MSISFNYNFPQVARDAGFKLRQYKDGPLDWRLLGSLEVERILQDQRLEQIDGVLSHLSETPLAALLDTNILDSGIAKYFILSQYAIQYLLFCRKFLDETVRELRDAHAASQLDLAQARKALAEANNEILQLHKKITQIEAIHEVVYPCHLCTKSFVSNEALNIHIGRRHAARIAVGTVADARRADTPASGPKEREHNDLNLINTIKLELEIKQLKERLNNAERDIRERSTANSKRTTPREPERSREMRHIGIQNNLMETKEQDDESLEEDSVVTRERKQQLGELQTKIHDFEQWRETQQLNNEESIAEINKKLSEIVQALEASKAVPPSLPPATEEAKSALQRRVSPSVEDLERLLTQKVNEIGRKSAEKLEEVVYNLEVNYKEKLHELEREIKKRNEKAPANSQPAGAIEMLPLVSEATTKTMVTPLSINESDSTTLSESSIERVPLTKQKAKRSVAADSRRSREVQVVSATKPQRNDDTYEIEDLNGKAKSQELSTRQKDTASEQKKPDSISTESNRTFVKLTKSKKALETKQSIDLPNDSTDITESLSEESKSDTDDTVTDTEQGSAPSKPKEADPKRVTKAEKAKAAPVEQQNVKRKKPKAQAQPKQCTRREAQKMLNRRIAEQGLDVKSKSISNAAMKRAVAELEEQRNKLKLKYPQFNVTRNKIKKLVDKLCSTKLPPHADHMLKTKKPLKPLEPVRPVQPRSSPRSPEGSSFEMLEQTSTPLKARDSDNFKQRLERILASPVQQPNKSAEHSVLTIAQVHGTPTANKPLPVPLARKRVMFNTRASEERDNINNRQSAS